MKQVKRRLENEQREREREERLRTERERQEEEKARRLEQYKQQLWREIAEEKARMREEEQKRLQLEAELCRRRDGLFNYKFGTRTGLYNFLGLQIEDVTQLRIGLFGPTDSGKTMFINTCERTLRQTENGNVPEVITGQEGGSFTLQDYLPEMFFRLVDTKGFFFYDDYEMAQFELILNGKIQSGDSLARDYNLKVSAPQAIYQKPEFSQRLHGVIFVLKAIDPRLKEKGFMTEYLEPFRDILRGTGKIFIITYFSPFLL